MKKNQVNPEYEKKELIIDNNFANILNRINQLERRNFRCHWQPFRLQILMYPIENLNMDIEAPQFSHVSSQINDLSQYGQNISTSSPSVSVMPVME
jgi:hypothetical protein